jgi:hypothetical protein
VAHRRSENWRSFLWLAGLLLISTVASASNFLVSGKIVDSSGRPVTGAEIQLSRTKLSTGRRARSGQDGRFGIVVMERGNYVLNVRAAGFEALSKSMFLEPDGGELRIEVMRRIKRNESVVVTADVNAFDVFSPDPAEKVFVHQDLLDANPGRPGAPVSIPGYPIETASSGIKAPQYFAPGVAGDHGEPIAQYISVGSYLLPNNLSANAHGNGYADPNILIPQVIESVQVDGGAFNVREGNHAVNLAATYGLRSQLDPFVAITGDYRDIDVVMGLQPALKSWIAIEAAYGNGFLDRLEHRRQYKFNGQRVFDVGRHQITLLGIGYYGSSYIPGLVPLSASSTSFPNVGDTIDPRQKDQTHTALVALNDAWRLSESRQLHLSGFFRTYNLALYSNFGQGLIRQSEFRTVAGQTTNYVNKFSKAFSLLAGLDYGREAPRRDNLDHYGFYTPGDRSYGPFTKVDSSNITLTSLAPYGAAEGRLAGHLHYYAGWRRDQVHFENEDLLDSANSFRKWVGVNSPKATISFVPKHAWFFPLIAASYGQAFFTEDPRIGKGTTPGTPINTAHSYQLVASKTVARTDVKLTLGHVTTSQSIGKIDADTGLQTDEGPGRLRFMTVAVRRNFSRGSVLATFSKADARDLDSGEPAAEAPRTIFDLLGNIQRLPLGLEARWELEYVGRKPLGTGCAPDPNAQCVGVPVKEFRAAVARPFLEGRLNLGFNMLIAGGYTGQTAENFGASDLQEIVGVRIPSYASLNVTYRFGREAKP